MGRAEIGTALLVSKHLQGVEFAGFTVHFATGAVNKIEATRGADSSGGAAGGSLCAAAEVGRKFSLHGFACFLRVREFFLLAPEEKKVRFQLVSQPVSSLSH